MPAERLEPFRRALFDLRRRLREGDLEPGDRVTPKEVAERLKLSATPVRETGEPAQEEDLTDRLRQRRYGLPQQHRLLGVRLNLNDRLVDEPSFGTAGELF